MPDVSTYNDLQRFSEMWDDAGLPKRTIAPLTAALQRSVAIEREEVALAAATRSAPAEIAAGIAAGEMSVAEGLAALTDTPYFAPKMGSGEPIGPGIVKDARAACHKVARTFLAANAHALVAEADAKAPSFAFGIRSWLELYGFLATAAEARPQGIRGVSGKAASWR